MRSEFAGAARAPDPEMGQGFRCFNEPEGSSREDEMNHYRLSRPRGDESVGPNATAYLNAEDPVDAIRRVAKYESPFGGPLVSDGELLVVQDWNHGSKGQGLILGYFALVREDTETAVKAEQGKMRQLVRNISEALDMLSRDYTGEGHHAFEENIEHILLTADLPASLCIFCGDFDDECKCEDGARRRTEDD